MSEMTATFIPAGYEHRGAARAWSPFCKSPASSRYGGRAHRSNLVRAGPGLVSPVLGQVLDALAGAPLRVVVLHRVDQLAHEARGQVDAGDHDTGDLLRLDLVVDAGEGDGELVVGVADVSEVRVYAPHDLGGQVDVYVALSAWVLIVHAASIATGEHGSMNESLGNAS